MWQHSSHCTGREINNSMGILRATLAALMATSVLTSVSFAASTAKTDLITHAAFFSAEMNLSQVIDPHIFVQDPAVSQAVGPLGIKHGAGLRPAAIEQDPKTAPLYTADGKPLGMTLGEWLRGTFSMTITGAAGTPRLDAAFSGLKPQGHYSLFERHSDQKTIAFTPIDGTGISNSFVAGADGRAKLSIKLAQPLPSTSTVVLIFHSDNQTHGLERGRIGFDAHHLVMMRPQ
jgi:hypothetical protein